MNDPVATSPPRPRGRPPLPPPPTPKGERQMTTGQLAVCIGIALLMFPVAYAVILIVTGYWVPFAIGG